jgi:hypothetical protein
MIVSCQYSGIEFTVENFAKSKVAAVHPLFYAKQSFLLSRTTDWAAGRFNEVERRIYFLSLLNSTELIEFRVPAVPADSTVQLNMESLIRFIGWQSAISSPRLVLPRFVVSPETRQLPNVKHWLEAWWDSKAEFENGYITTTQLTKLRNREAALEKLIKNAALKTDDYAGMLGAWAVEASNCPAAIKEYWISLFKLKGFDIYNAKRVDLEEMLEHMEDNLEQGSIYAHNTLKHIRILLAKNKTGLNFGLGIPDEDAEKEDFLNLSLPVKELEFRIVEDSIETHNKNVAIAAAPTNEPQMRDFAGNRLAYLKAKAKWNLAQKRSI